ncbi:hypothetical protein BH20ACT4_BH20ACT4_07690 [soil metagenome]
MTDTRALVERFLATLEARDWDAFGAVLDADVVYEIPQTRERIRGRDPYVQFNAEYPGEWHLSPRTVLVDGTAAVARFGWSVGGEEDGEGIAFFATDGERITSVTDFWPEAYEPPPGREHLTERW